MEWDFSEKKVGISSEKGLRLLGPWLLGNYFPNPGSQLISGSSNQFSG